MAQKKITDLQLRDNVTDELNFPSDDTIQSYRVTAEQLFDYILANENILLPMLKLDIFTGLTSVTPADDDYFPLIDTSDSNKTKKGLVGSFVRAVYRSVTSTDNVLTSDSTMKLSGASFTSTLPTAVGVAGKRYKYVHAGTSLSQVYTLATTSGQTIGGVASGSYSLYTNGETLEIESDGANWLILNHYARTALTAGSAITIGAITTPPTKDASPVLDRLMWARDGEWCEMIIDLTQDSVGTAGSGNYLFTLPTNITFDSAVYSYFTTAIAQNAIGKSTNMVGHAYISYGLTTNGAHGSCVAYDASTFRIFATDSTNANTVDGASNYGIGGAHANYHCYLRFKVPNWRP